MSFAKVALAIFRKSLRTMRFGASRSMFCLNHHKKRQDLFILFVAINSCMLMATCKFHRFQWKFQALGRKVLKALQLHEFQDHGLTMYSKVRVLLTCPKYPKVFHAMKSMERHWGPQTQLLSGNQSDKGFSATWGALVHRFSAAEWRNWWKQVAHIRRSKLTWEILSQYLCRHFFTSEHSTDGPRRRKEKWAGTYSCPKWLLYCITVSRNPDSYTYNSSDCHKLLMILHCHNCKTHK